MLIRKERIGILMLWALIACNWPGCAGTPMKFDPNSSGPQLIVDPPVIRLGVARLLNDTQLVFSGKGFTPGDSIYISLVGVKKSGGVADVPIADAVVEADGRFSAEVVKLVKITEFLQADTELNDQMEMCILISRPPIPAETYTVRVESMDSDKKAECRLVIKEPSLVDSIKDWIGGLLGKIKRK